MPREGSGAALVTRSNGFNAGRQVFLGVGDAGASMDTRLEPRLGMSASAPLPSFTALAGTEERGKDLGSRFAEINFSEKLVSPACTKNLLDKYLLR